MHEEANIRLNQTNNCGYVKHEDLEIRFPLVVVNVFVMCIAGGMGNILSIGVLSRPQMRSSSSWFLIALAIFDTGVLVLSVSVYAVEILYDYADSEQLYFSWFSYVRTCFFLSNWFQVSTVYLTVAATVERWIAVGFPKAAIYLCTPQRSFVGICVAISCSLCLTISKLWEVMITVNENCTTFGHYTLEPGPLLEEEVHPWYVEIYSVWISNLFFIFLPFMALLVLNGMVFYKIKRHAHPEFSRNASFFAQPWCLRMDERQRRAKSKEATKILLIVVLVFLVCNLPSLILTLLERADIHFLLDHQLFYSLFRDFANLMTIANSAINFFIYIIFGKGFRKQLLQMLCCR